ncbi:MAG: tRNA (adenosine(37)-N6)-threonylcarbamoyltransferase complex ATPase subunit type 1 TsaE [Candidatus Gracilibacteria bacterium]|nr:tRNA (adenosine(37)-N6)-threonylcarbamoyltransferase complex ATPase subunit type 1 TsaE [Candidatus Gracilibacteria bacterium]
MYSYKLDEIKNINLLIKKGNIIFLNGDLRAGKTTLSKHIINDILQIEDDVRSPTYTYYNKYGENIYHFDLYRLKNYDEFFAIAGEEILDNPENICIIEWPDILRNYFIPDIEIKLEKVSENERSIEIIYNNK